MKHEMRITKEWKSEEKEGASVEELQEEMNVVTIHSLFSTVWLNESELGKTSCEEPMYKPAGQHMYFPQASINTPTGRSWY